MRQSKPIRRKARASGLPARMMPPQAPPPPTVNPMDALAEPPQPTNTTAQEKLLLAQKARDILGKRSPT